MYGGCEGLQDNSVIVHNLLRRYGIWNGSVSEVKKYLPNQLVVPLEDDEDADLTQTENIVKFLNKHSKYGKNVRDIEELGETLSSMIYKVSGADDDIVIKVPKNIEDASEVAFLDLIYQTQLMQFLKDNRTDGEKQFFPSVYEEIFVLNKNTRTILNYVTVVE